MQIIQGDVEIQRNRLLDIGIDHNVRYDVRSCECPRFANEEEHHEEEGEEGHDYADFRGLWIDCMIRCLFVCR